MDVFYGLAGLTTKMGTIQNSVNLLILAGSHPASTFETKQKAIKLLAERSPGFTLDPGATIESYQSLEWEKIAAELIEK